MKLTKFEDSFHERLRDREYAQLYLQTALSEGGNGEWLAAIREVAASTEGGVTRVAEQASLGRESMYKSLSPGGNPRWETVRSVLDVLGFELTIQKKTEVTRRRAGAIVTRSPRRRKLLPKEPDKQIEMS